MSKAKVTKCYTTPLHISGEPSSCIEHHRVNKYYRPAYLVWSSDWRKRQQAWRLVEELAKSGCDCPYCVRARKIAGKLGR